MRIINFGSLNIDYVYAVDHFVQPGETILSNNMQIFPGGKGLNQSIAISRAGGNVTHAGMYSQEGNFLYDMLNIEGVDISVLKKVNASNGHAIIQVDKYGENSIILFSGTNGMIDENYINEVLKNIQGDEMFLFQNETSLIAYAMKKIKEHGCKIVFNPAPMNDKVKEYPLEYVDVFIVNKTEGMGLSGESESDEILKSLNSKYPNAKIILTLGENGSWYSFEDEKFHVSAYKVDYVVDTTAAGDTFIGYYIANISNGVSDKQALELASRAAAICVTKNGAAVSIPCLTDRRNTENKANS